MGMFDEVLNNVGEPYKAAGKGFKYGTHKVLIGLVEPTQKKTQANPNADVIEVEVFNPDDEDQTAKATLYFHTEGGARMSVTKILGIMVHNVGEDKKEKVRELGKSLFASIDDPKEARDVAAKLMMDKFMGDQKKKPYEAYLFVDPQGKYDTSSYGDLWHYEYEDPNADDRAEKKEAIEGEELKGDELKQATDTFDDL